jgi:hydroxyacylglutathione hydrolase
MFIETFRSSGLAHLGYMIGDGHEALVIDPRRDVADILESARARGVAIRHILETHRNEDYVTGSRELARRTGAVIYHGSALDFGYGEPAREGMTFEAGSVRVDVLETPGHTPESLSFVLRDTSTGDSPLAVFTGDALFVGDVGRTDLGESEAENAKSLHASLHEKILPLGDQVMIFPAHGAGSVCGEGMANRDTSTIGYEKRHNPSLALSLEDFMERKTAEEHVVPPYFEDMETLNLEGPPVLGGLEEPPPLSPAELEARAARGARVVDVRSAEAFTACAVPGALALPLSVLSAYAGWFLPADRDLVLVASSPGDAEQARRELLRIGRERVVGWMHGLTAWETSGRPLQTLGVAPSPRILSVLGERPESIIDVRKPSEWRASHLPGSTHVFLGELPRALGTGALPSGRLIALCGSGQRATVAASLLAAEHRQVDVAFGSFRAARQLGAHTTPGLDAPRA